MSSDNRGLTSVTPYLIVRGAAAAIEYYRNVFDGTVTFRQEDGDGRIRHADVRIGDGSIMLTDEAPEQFADWRGPEFYGGSPVHVYLYVSDADGMFARALAAGGRELLPMQDQPYGERSGGVIDPFGHVWYIATMNAAAASDAGGRHRSSGLTV